MTKQELAKQIYQVSYLTGEFKLRSGTTSNEYFDKYRFESLPTLLKEIAKQMAPLVPKDTELLAGLEMGGIPIATALSLETGIPCVFVRKQAKTYGTCLFAEGAEIKNKTLCMIEDVVTTGGQVAVSYRDLVQSGAKIHSVLCVIHRNSDENKVSQAGLKLYSLFTQDELNKYK